MPDRRELAVSPPADPRGRRDPSQASPADFIRLGTPQRVALLPDGTLLAVERSRGVAQLFARAAGAPADAPLRRITEFADGLSGYSVAPDGKTVLLTAAPGGNEQTQVYALDLPAALAPGAEPHAQVRPILQNPQVVYGPGPWLKDSSGFFYRANDVSPRDFHLYRYDLARGVSTPVLAREGAWFVSDVTDDGRFALVVRGISASQSEVYRLDLSASDPGAGADASAMIDLSVRSAAGELASVSPVGFLAGAPGATGATVLMVSDHEDGVASLYVRAIDGAGAVSPPRRVEVPVSARPESERHTLAPGPIIVSPRAEVDDATLCSSRSLVAVVTNEDGYAALHVLDAGTFAPLPLPAMERGVAGVSMLRDRQLVYTLSNARQPNNAYAVRFDAGNAPRPAPGSSPGVPLLGTDDQGIDFSAFELPTLVHFGSFDGQAIPAFLYRPATGRGPGGGAGAGARAGAAEDAQPIPFIVSFHGGPEGQSRPGFARGVQLWVSRGYGVLVPNVRGSTGYGRAFQQADDYRRRWDSVKDGVEACRWLVESGHAEAGRIAVEGGSYGGFMAVATAIEDQRAAEADGPGGREPVIGALINTVGIVNLRTFLEQTRDYRRALREVEYGPLSDPEFLREASPLTHAQFIRVPAMIIHGLNDPRVPVGEAMQLAVALQKRGDDPELLFFPDEGHGTAKAANRQLVWERQLRFLDRTIGPEAPTRAGPHAPVRVSE